MQRSTLAAGLGFLMVAGLIAISPKVFAWSTEEGSASNNFANVADPDEQRPALVNSGATVTHPNPAEQDMDRYANEARAPQLTGPSSIHTGFGSFGPGSNYGR